MTAEKLLSIIIVGRNDDYLGAYLYRLQTCLNFLAMNLGSLNRLSEVEVVFVDWNSAKAPLSAVIEVTEAAAEILRFVIVSPEIAEAANSKISFFTTCAVNVGVRRARGAFIMLADSDSIMPLPALRALLETLDGTRPTLGPRNELIYPIPRHQLPGQLSLRTPNPKAWEYTLSRIFPSRRKEMPGADCLGGFAAAQLMHRNLWEEFGGYNERLDRSWGWSDNDLMLRVTRKYGWMDLGYQGVAAFHIQPHWHDGEDTYVRDPSSINLTLNTYTSNPNGPDWGLKSLPLEQVCVTGNATDAPQASWSFLNAGPMTTSDFRALVNEGEISDIRGRAAHHLRFRSKVREQAQLDEAAISATVVAIVAGRARNVLYVGSIHPAVLISALYANPGIDLFLAACWTEGDLGSQSFGPGMLGILLTTAPFLGYARILNGPVTQALATLDRTEAISMPIEVAIIHRDDIENDFEIFLGELLDHLVPGGSVIVTDEKRRLPMQPQALQIYLGRLIYRSRNPHAVAKQPFFQGDGERAIGGNFAAITLNLGSVYLIRKKDGIQKNAIQIINAGADA